jgi:Leucine-rich repeat (LRR) protein
LLWLDLSHNRVTMVPDEIGRLVNLKGLILAYNVLSTLPPEIGNFTNLEQFCLYPMTFTLPPPVAALKEQTTCDTYAY